VEEMAASLHTELGVTLLTYCYAYAGGREIDALAFDPHFIRKHDFYLQGPRSSLGWIPSQVRRIEAIGTHISGSLAGLSYSLSRLEVEQSIRSFGKMEGVPLLPTLLTGMRAVPMELRSDRAQEYVALSMRLGRRILVRAASEEQLTLWCRDRLTGLLAPPRRARLMDLLGDRNPMAAVDMLAPSELFFLGESYLQDGKDKSLIPRTLERLYHALELPAGRRFCEERDQYGVLLQKRLGLTQLSLDWLDSYEQLEKSSAGGHIFERLCDLKMKLAEINYTQGLPACLAELQGERALRDILPDSAVVRPDGWTFALEQIANLGARNVDRWFEDLLGLGFLKLQPNQAGNQ
jgi:hypothetical protein